MAIDICDTYIKDFQGSTENTPLPCTFHSFVSETPFVTVIITKYFFSVGLGYFTSTLVGYVYCTHLLFTVLTSNTPKKKSNNDMLISVVSNTNKKNKFLKNCKALASNLGYLLFGRTKSGLLSAGKHKEMFCESDQH